MSRLKYRGYVPHAEKMVEVTGLYFNREGLREVTFLPVVVRKHKHSYNPNTNRLPAKDVILLEFTGLTDKNGKEIYEGDIVTRQFWKKGTPHLVEYSQDSFIAKEGKNHIVLGIIALDEEGKSVAEVIGNIHENPELVK